MSGTGDAGRGRPSLAAVVVELAASLALYLAVEADATTVQAWRMRGWHLTRRLAYGSAYRLGRLGLLAERRYDQIKG